MTAMTESMGSAGAVPTTAERIRSVWVRGQALLAVAGREPTAAPVCHLLDDGSVALAIDAAVADAAVADAADAAAARGPGELTEPQAMLELTDYAPVPLRERVRALVWVRGRLQPVPPGEIAGLLDLIAEHCPDPALLQVRSPRSRASQHGPDGGHRYRLLRLHAESVVVADTTGAESVEPAELLAAAPDPLCGIEAAWLRHVDSAHPDVIARLADRLPARLQRGRVRPLGIDRHGIWLRVEDEDGDHDARLGFTRPVDDVAGLNRAVRLLMGCPFRNGVHARRS